MVRAQIGRCVDRAVEHARLLETIAATSIEISFKIYRDAPAAEILRSAHRLRGLAADGLRVLAGLENDAGRLEAMVAVREVYEVSVH